MTHIIGAPGPEPLDSIAEADLNRRLAEIDGLLRLQWCPNAGFDPRTQQTEGRYAIVCQWPSADPRWEAYRNGEIGEPFDILCWATKGELSSGDELVMGGADDPAVDPDAIWELILARLKEADMARGPSWKARMKEVVEKNLEIRKMRRKEAAGDLADGIIDYRRQVQNIPFLPVGIDLKEQ